MLFFIFPFFYHVGGLGKVTIRQAIIAGECLIKEVDEMVEYLESKFSDKVHPDDVFHETAAKFLKDKWTEDCLKNFHTIEGLSRFQFAVFQPGKSTVHAALYLSICKVCMEKEYGSCSLFEEYYIVVQLKEIAFQANVEETTTESDSEVALNFAQVDTVVAIPEPNKNSPNMVSFVKAVAQCMKEGKEQIIDEWGQAIKGGQSYLEVWYLSHHTENNK